MSVEEYVARTTAEQGKPLHVEDPEILKQVASMVLAASQTEVGKPSQVEAPVSKPKVA